MNDFSAIDGFLNTFITYIDSGFGLISGDVTSLAAILVVIDVTIAALFWAWGQNTDIIQSLVKKTLYVGAFAFIFGNFAMLSTIIFDSFATLGLNASAASFSPADLLKPGLVAAEGLATSRPIFDHIGAIAPGPVEFFGNLTEVILLCLGGIMVIAAFFVLSIQLFVLIVEFKITTLAGFVLVPFAFWRQTTFLAERVLGNVISSGIKVLVIAVVIGIGSTMFSTLRTALSPDDMTIEQAFAVVLGALTLMGLAIFCPRIAAGLVSGAPQLSAGAAAGTAIGVGAAGAGAFVAGRAAAGAAASATRAAANGGASAAGGLRAATALGAMRTGLSGPIAAPLNAAIGLGASAAGGLRQGAGRIAAHFRTRGINGARAVTAAAGAVSPAPAAAGAGSGPASGQPAWARRFRQTQAMREGALVAAHTLGAGDGGGASEGPNLKQRE
ncbi:MAG TPA: P-type conjugative transfer protein TrbL [Hyphomonadaceae bacterium]|jgi:type IV secretion system protein TrbL|nr:P-type conjugative transfer protein TrbL [Hyphomonadaceae bacterium]